LPTGGSIACGGEDDVTTPALETASWARRVLALFVDWFASTLAVIAFVGLDSYSETGSNAQLYVLLVYVVESALFTWLLGGSFGKLATRLRVVPADGRLRPLNPLKALLRQAMIALVIPPLVYRSDGRGLHDLVAGTVTVTLATFRGLRPGP
jgi:uncharacterized RDD family membrane protein YckC